MNKTALSLAIVTLIPTVVIAQDEGEIVDFYGKANVTLHSFDEGDGSATDVQSNASRLGVKGEIALTESIKGIYRMEYEVDMDGDAEDTFSQRNIYAGLEGGFGQVIAGKFDTPLKVAQKKVDLFNDLEGDIKSLITKSDNRETDSFQYTTPSFAGFKASAAYISHKDAVIGYEVIGLDEAGDEILREITRENGVSVSIAYDNNGVYLAYAVDQDVEENDRDVQRFVAQYNIGSLQVGALFEDQEKADGSRQDGWMGSVAYKIEPWTLKAQYGHSDIVKEDGKTYSLGVDYKFSSAAKVFGFYTDESAEAGYDRNYAGIGAEYKF
ncbi:porin [Microbulbifer sp. 2205BS26-8]|uniref:porin n=1 Tax=Microbulbifer sp. 2205BS26-8 TaxID=3064386 RepID=UPI00273FD015|nr:porin [Microbulbifer sp. 2205BS26-8]MDP5208673.1 porin [Microbulbifer sp. 2205BS26-8]